MLLADQPVLAENQPLFGFLAEPGVDQFRLQARHQPAHGAGGGLQPDHGVLAAGLVGHGQDQSALHAAPSVAGTFRRGADASQARFALIFGQDEVAGGMVALKPLRASPGETTAAPQRLCPLDDVNAWVNDLRA